LLTLHHIVADLWSFEVIIEEFEMLYSGVRPKLEHPSAQYSDFVSWQAEMLAGPDGERLAAFWQRVLSEPLPVLALPGDRPRPPAETYHGATHTFVLDLALSNELRTLARRFDATLYSVLLAAFQLFLCRLSGQQEVIVGSPANGRSRAAFAGMVGYCVNP